MAERFDLLDRLEGAYQRQLKELRKKYRNIDKDLQAAYSAIVANPFGAQHATPILGFSDQVFKY